MIPQRRFLTLLEQSRLWQQQRCPYHNSPPDSMSFSLYRDHLCDSSCFPNTTTTILEVHTDEVWNIEWSHSGEYLASAGKDKSAIIWRVGVSRHFHLPGRSLTLGLFSPRKSQLRGSTHSTSSYETISILWGALRGLSMTRYYLPAQITTSRCGIPVYVRLTIRLSSYSRSPTSPACVCVLSKLTPRR